METLDYIKDQSHNIKNGKSLFISLKTLIQTTTTTTTKPRCQTGAGAGSELVLLANLNYNTFPV